jgi:YesN/AraC family two-component response regulator
LRAEGIEVPVLVLTGFGDFESARVAGTFGAAFRAKPLDVDDLEVAVHELIARSPTSVDSFDHVPDAAQARQRAEFLSIAHLLEQLQRVSDDDNASARYEVTHLRILTILLRTLANPALPMPVFLACAMALKKVVTPGALTSASALPSEVETTVMEALARSTGWHAKVARAIGMLQLAAERHHRIKIDEVAESFLERFDAERLGTLIKEQTGFYFTDWRTAFLVRPSVAPLLNTTEDVKQIVRKLSAFKSLSHFDHEFVRFFGISPSDFRGLWRSNRS